MWSLHESEAINAIIKDSYKQSRQEHDLNQPLSVQSWGRDGDKRRYWLIEGRDDTPFRLYRESNPVLKTITWRSVAGSIDELREVVTKLETDGTQHAKRLATRINLAIPRFEASEDVWHSMTVLTIDTNTNSETQASRIPPQPQSRLHSS